jgi:hypothetical protein
MKHATKLGIAVIGVGIIAIGALGVTLYAMARGLEDLDFDAAYDDDGDDLFGPGFLIEL